MRQVLRDCLRLLKRRLYVSGSTEREIVDSFHRLYHQTGKIMGSWGVTWRGRPVAQNPMDLMAIAGIIQKFGETDCYILEIGSGHGGSAFFFANAGAMFVDSWDLNSPPTDPRFAGTVHFETKDSRDGPPAGMKDRIYSLVILDGDHHAEIVGKELFLYHRLVRLGGYLIICDTHFNGHPIAPEFGPGPWEAVEQFLASPAGAGFVRDRDVEPLLTWNPGGYLRRVK